MKAIYKKEIEAYFTSMLGYIVMALYFLLSGFFFWSICFQSGSSSLRAVINYMLYAVFFLVPIMTMKSFSEEKRQHTDQALLTAPVRLSDIVLGKYFGVLTMYGICNVIFFVFALTLTVAVPGIALRWDLFLSAWLGIIVLGAALISVNIFISSLTEYQIISAVIGLGLGLLFMLYDSILSAVGSFINTLFSISDYKFTVLDKISVTAHYSNFVSGVFDPADLVFFLSWIALFLFLTVRVLDRKRWA